MSTEQPITFVSNHHLYYVIARRNLNQAREIARELEEQSQTDDQIDAIYVAQHGRPDPDYNSVAVERNVEMLERQDQHLAQAVVFSALAIEAFINYYGVRKTSTSYFKKHFDKLSIRKKWRAIPTTVNGDQNPSSWTQPLKGLKKLIDKRNDLVHAKPSIAVKLTGQGEFESEPLTSGRYYGTSVDDAERCVETVGKLVRTLKEIDEAVELGWLEEDRPDRIYFNLPDRI